MSDISRWAIPYPARGDAKLRMFCFPFAGGAASAFKHFYLRLPDWLEIYAIQYPGRETRWSETPLATAPELAEAIVEGIQHMLPEKPFVFFGHSLGAMMCYETARLLAGTNSPEPRKLFLSGRRAPGFDPHPPAMTGLSDDAFKAELVEFNGTPPAVLEHKELMGLLMPMLRADFALDENYQHLGGPALWQDFSIYGGELDVQVPQEHLRAWSAYTSGASSFQTFPGDHFYLKNPESPMFEVLSGELANCLL